MVRYLSFSADESLPQLTSYGKKREMLITSPPKIFRKLKYRTAEISGEPSMK